MKTIEEHESQVRSYSRNFPATFSTSSGAYLYDEANNRYVDFFSGAGALNYGHNDEDMKEALIGYISRNGIVHSLDMATVAKESFIDNFIRYVLKPRGLDYKIQFTGPTGANAVEAAVKLAQIVKGRNQIISFTNAYHGHSKGALRLTANSYYREGLEDDLSQSTTFLPFSGYLGPDIDTSVLLDKLLSDKGSGLSKPAAIILETIQGEGGINVATQQWLRNMREITSRHGILMIIDDIQSGCGRTGDFFSFEFADIQPDMVVLSKSISGCGLPMSLLLIKPEIDAWKPGQHTGTFRGNNYAFITAALAIEKYWKDDQLSHKVKRESKAIVSLLQEIKDEYPGELSIRGRGFMIGLEFKDKAMAVEVSKACFKNGLVIETCGAEDQVLKLFPPLTISAESLDEGLEILNSSIVELMRNKKPVYL
ncbi:diaminobutyrate--2-oxoglutarate transaminase [Pedobacter sp. KBW06]|uniref:diaminobutyrate--2-oxoglutarate transaminase n=1 Tax=Pedobacter sp. KBW06 TaxID=2153359 RepID=UPI000F5A0366|nr:diaminobutyrate--2-oxoglutarate transaminase [Pedobacter sp. KBW06]RQO65363.1 diaminobutyrate--2-oxoglutarate transaminase [Pedobacter sp. KBW06]